MKRTILAALLAVTSLSAFASEELDVYTFLYRMASNSVERFAVLRNISDAKVAGAGSIYAEALSQVLVEFPTLKTTAERDTADQSARLLVSKLGEEKYAASAPDLWKTVETFSNPLVKADALMALGRTRAPEFFPQVQNLLHGLNLKPTQDPEAGEKTAYGAVIAMEKYRNIDGYTDTFFAANGWYSRRIKDQAFQTLPFIVDDPSKPLTGIINSDTYPVKLLALQKENESKAPAAAKAEVAAIALDMGWRAATNDVKEKALLNSMRKLSIAMLVNSNASDPVTVPLLSKSYYEGLDMEEKLSAITAMSANKTDDSAKAMSSILMYLNGKRRSGGITAEDERLVRALLPAMGSQGNVLCKPALQSVGYLDWTNAVKNLAEEALKKIK